MPPVDTQPQSVIRYLTRLLAALAIQAGGELHIPMKEVRQVAEEDHRQALLEDTDTEKDEIVLRFGSKSFAVYPVEPDKPCDSTNTKPPVQPKQEQKPTTRAPLSMEQLNLLERTIHQKKAAAVLRAEQRQRDSSNPSELNFPD